MGRDLEEMCSDLKLAESDVGRLLCCGFNIQAAARGRRSAVGHPFALLPPTLAGAVDTSSFFHGPQASSLDSEL